ncbi:uncharacterized protein LOC111116790 [Crassostrea virginica]
MDGMLTAIFFVLLFYTRVEAYLPLVEPEKTTVNLSSTYLNYSASRAVDGDVTQTISRCSHTDANSNIKEAWLRVDLKNTYSIKSVKFWYRNDDQNTKRLPGYSIRVSNDSALPPPESSCYTDPKIVKPLPTLIEKDCVRTARYVWIYQNNTLQSGDVCPMLEICEVQVFGCEPGMYGVNCTMTCSHCKNNSSCGIVNGKCNDEGCAYPGYQTPYCQSCIDGIYGNVCNVNCSEFCKNKRCERKTGACTDGCLAGYSGSRCDQNCKNNSYGQNCSKTCGQCLKRTCDHVNGICTGGCKAGYRTELCNAGCINGTYGPGCKFECSKKCLDKNSCNKVDGTCSKCLPGWQKRLCNALQLVEPGYATSAISSVYGNHPGSMTIDGNTNQHISNCSHTAVVHKTEAWLRVDLKRIFSLYSVKFWYRNDRTNNYTNTIRLRGYSIRVSNDTDTIPPESSCYTDPGNVILPTIIEKDCEKTARYVWIYQDERNRNEVPMLEICEVQVFGCETGIDKEQCQRPCTHCKDSSYCKPGSRSCNREGCAFPGYQAPLCQACVDGQHGKNCEKNCSSFCKNQSCERTTGHCTHGCQWGYTGSHCNQKCEPGRYGHNCNETCGHCLQNPCDYVTGTCIEGCKAGFKTTLCKTSCDDGEYGENCKYNCSGNCLNGTVCDPKTGTCQSCAGGFNGEKCDQKCGNGTYGVNCSEDCGACLNDTECHHVTGECPSGCEQGWKTTKKCDKGCIDGRYGNNCGKICNKFCWNQTCQQTKGICVYGCLKGYTGERCNKTCEFGKYGQNCNETCGKCFENTCNHVNGICADGCAAGFMTNLCKTRCKDGRYGRDCQFNCSGNCLNEEVCDKQNGTCESCAEGYQGVKCDKRCETGSYGLNCTKNCAACLHDTDCHHVTGMCSSGCKKGWKDVEKCDKGCVDGRYGNDCAKNCSKLCKYQTCEQTKGVCLHGCLEGYTGWECSEPQDLSDPTNNYQPILFGVVMCTSLVFNIVSVILMVRHGVCQRKRGNQSLTEETAVPPIIYDAVEDNNEYQELGQLSESSHYTELQKI